MYNIFVNYFYHVVIIIVINIVNAIIVDIYLFKKKNFLNYVMILNFYKNIYSF